jgi:hypothetical protein
MNNNLRAHHRLHVGHSAPTFGVVAGKNEQLALVRTIGLLASTLFMSTDGHVANALCDALDLFGTLTQRQLKTCQPPQRDVSESGTALAAATANANVLESELHPWLYLPSELLVMLTEDVEMLDRSMECTKADYAVCLSVIRVCSAVVAQYGERGARWLLRQPVTRGKRSSRPHLVICLTRSLYCKLHVLGRTGGEVAAFRSEYVQHAFGLLAMLWSVAVSESSRGMGDVNNVRDSDDRAVVSVPAPRLHLDEAQKHELRAVLVALRQLGRVEKAWKSVGRRAEVLLASVV